MNKASGGDTITADLFKIPKDNVVSAALNMSANVENSAVATGLEKVSFNYNPKEGQYQSVQTVAHLHLVHMLARLCSKSFKLGFSSI